MRNSKFPSHQTGLVLNVSIVVIYVLIAFLIDDPWTVLTGFMLLAVSIRAATFCYIGHWPMALLNFFFGILFSGAVILALWTFGLYWLSAVKILVPLLMVFVAYQSLFPLMRSE